MRRSNRGQPTAWMRITALGLATLALAGVDGGTRPAHAASLVVTTLVDNTAADGQCSLREAMTNAINAAGTFADCAAGGNSDIITFSLSGTIVLTSQLPSVVGNAFFLNALEIDGAGQSIVISGNNAVRHFDVAAVSRLTLRNLTISGGRAPAAGSFSRGGAVTNAGTLIVRTSTFSGNTAVNGSSGGVATAGAIAANAGSVTEIYDSTFVNNTTSATNGFALGTSGGAISASGTPTPDITLIVDKSTFNGNSSTGPNASGGAIALGTGTFTADIVNSTFSSNAANSVTGLIAPGGGGAITMSAGVVDIFQSTFAANKATRAGALGGGLRNTGGVATLHSSILANAGPAGSVECTGAIGTGGFLTLAQAAVPGCALAGATIGVPAGLGPLASNGGPTQTHALLAGSPALNVAAALICSSAQVNNQDQRGFTRPSGPACDLGAFELGGAAPVLGGKNLKITTGSVDLTWTGGAAQAAYKLIKYNTTTAVLTLIDLPTNAVSYSDAATANGIIYCYALVPVDPFGISMGLSDLLCGMPGMETGTVIPNAFALALNQTATATMTWTAPAGGADSYLLQRIPLDGSPITNVALGAGPPRRPRR